MTQSTLAPRPRRGSRFGPLLPIGTLIGFLIAITAIVVVARLSYSALKDTVGGAQRVTNTREVVEHLQSLLSTVKDAETGMERGTAALTADLDRSRRLLLIVAIISSLAAVGIGLHFAGLVA